jgi:hypothetical protein
VELNILPDHTSLQILEQVLWTVAWVYGIFCLMILCTLAAAGFQAMLSRPRPKRRKIASGRASIEVRRARGHAVIPGPSPIPDKSLMKA